jgi:glycosyltransferase involved in cell wall biosynthesis
MTASVTAIILTHNEELHIERCIASLRPYVSRVVVVDSGSNDRTVEIAKRNGAEVFSHPFKNYATQFNWSLNNCAIATNWVMRIDADEYIDAELGNQIKTQVSMAEKGVNGFVVERRIKFLGGMVRFGGGVSPQRLLKIWRVGKGEVENRWMDEHTVLFEGTTANLSGLLVDENLKDFSFWIDKHNRYAVREMIDSLNREFHFFDEASLTTFSTEAKLKRTAKASLYGRLPLAYRALVYFIYRYIFRLGFLDGKTGFLFHFMQGFWYRLLVDIKITEAQSFIERNGLAEFKKTLAKNYGLKL